MSTPVPPATFHDPKRVAINRVYTRTGDAGTTSLVGGQKVPKEDLRIETYGAVDELNAWVGHVCVSLAEHAESAEHTRLGRCMHRIQHQLFNLGSVLATLPADLHPQQPRVVQADIDWLEAEMDRCNGTLEPLRSFVLPGGNRINVDLHVCRTVCRRAERLACALARQTEVDPLAVAYLNRLSDAFFVFSRWVVAIDGGTETLWQPNLALADIDPAAGA